METDEKALYLYCFARSNFLGGLEGPGIDGLNPPLVFRRFPNPCAIASEVAVEDFCGAAAAVRLRDAAWVGPRAARHEAVVEEAMRGSPVLPVRFGTLFLNQEELAEFLDQQRTVISEFLEQVSGLEEWSVRGLLDRWRAGRAFAAAIPPSPEEQFAARTPGRIQFAEPRVLFGLDKELNRWIEETRWQATRDLMAQASDYCECPKTAHASRANGVEVVMDFAYLLPHHAAAAFRQRIDELNTENEHRGLVFKMSGPRPPYRFVPPLALGVTS